MQDFRKKAETICDNIRKIRELKGWTRDYLAAELNLSPSGYGKIERGEVELTLSKLYQISIVLETEVDQILNLNPATILNPQEKSPKEEVVHQLKPSLNQDTLLVKYVLLLEEKIQKMEASFGLGRQAI
ncbi:helix-turn-helix domain-containing protein [Croceimicrobium sp.]|uniref:helix-turn-helix domain-containing protein n=1 Tax=Croceimicrobium sp. TaxID=2828340 RepID=UPI003BA8457C